MIIFTAIGILTTTVAAVYGFLQFKELADEKIFLKNYTQETYLYVYKSPIKRCKQIVAIIKLRLQKRFKVRRRLMILHGPSEITWRSGIKQTKGTYYEIFSK